MKDTIFMLMVFGPLILYGIISDARQRRATEKKAKAAEELRGQNGDGI